jgi:hypothetical protein
VQLADWDEPEPLDDTQPPFPQRTEKAPETPDMLKVTGTVTSPPDAESVPPPRISARADSRHATSLQAGDASSCPAPPDSRALNPDEMGSLMPADHSSTLKVTVAAFRADAFCAWVVGVPGDVVTEGGRVVCVGRLAPAVVLGEIEVDVVDDGATDTAGEVVVVDAPPIVRSDAGGKPGFTSGACNTSGSASATVCPLITSLSTSDVSVPSTETTRLAISVGPDCVTTS